MKIIVAGATSHLAQEFINLLEINNKKDIIDYTLSLYEKSRL